jgi:hypothetical protein
VSAAHDVQAQARHVWERLRGLLYAVARSVALSNKLGHEAGASMFLELRFLQVAAGNKRMPQTV